MQVSALHGYLSRAIPLFGAMQVETREAGIERVVLAAPLAPNVNHQGTAFGGSIAALATLACWGWLWIYLREHGPDAKLVVAKSEIDYLLPLTSTLIARCEAPDEIGTTAFLRWFTNKGRARIELSSVVTDADGKVCARYTGQFFADNRGT